MLIKSEIYFLKFLDTLHKKSITIIICLVVLISFGMIFNCFKPNDTKESVDLVLDKVVFDGIEFTNGNIINENGYYTYAVDIKNVTEKDFEVKEIKFKFYVDDEETIELKSYIKKSIKVNETQNIFSSIDTDISNYKKLILK